MTAVIVPPRVPLVDVRTGTITREWYLVFQSLFRDDHEADQILAALAPPPSLDTGTAPSEASFGVDPPAQSAALCDDFDYSPPRVDALPVQLAAPRKIGITGAVDGTPTDFDGSKDIGIPVVVSATYADEAAASAAGLVSGRIYKTPTGELRIKL